MQTTRRDAFKHGGKVIATATLLPFLPTIALGANNDAALVRMEKEVFGLIDEINAGHHSPGGEVSDEVTERENGLIDAITDTPARGLEGVAVKLRLAAYEIGEIAQASDTTEYSCVLSALETVKRLAGDAI